MIAYNKGDVAQKIIEVRNILDSKVITIPMVTGRLVNVQIDTRYDLYKANHNYLPETNSVSFYVHAKRMNRRDYCELFGTSIEVASTLDFVLSPHSTLH